MQREFACNINLHISGFTDLDLARGRQESHKGRTTLISVPPGLVSHVFDAYVVDKLAWPTGTFAFFLVPQDCAIDFLYFGFERVRGFKASDELHAKSACNLDKDYALYYDRFFGSQFDAYTSRLMSIEQPSTVSDADIEITLPTLSAPKMQFDAELSGVLGRVLMDTGTGKVYLAKTFADNNNISMVPTQEFTCAVSANGTNIEIYGMALVHLRLQSLSVKVDVGLPI